MEEDGGGERVERGRGVELPTSRPFLAFLLLFLFFVLFPCCWLSPKCHFLQFISLFSFLFTLPLASCFSKKKKHFRVVVRAKRKAASQFSPVFSALGSLRLRHLLFFSRFFSPYAQPEGLFTGYVTTEQTTFLTNKY